MDRATLCISGASGKLGSAVIRQLEDDERHKIVGAIGCKSVGKTLGELGVSRRYTDVRVQTSEAAFGTHFDVLIEFAPPNVGFSHVMRAIGLRRHAIVGTVGFAEREWHEVHMAASEHGVSVIAASNLAMTFGLLQSYAIHAAKLLSAWQVQDSASPSTSAPLGTSLELVQKLMAVGRRTDPPPHIHSTRLPGVKSVVEVTFGDVDEQLTIRHTCLGPGPYAKGALFALDFVGQRTGLTRGLEALLGGP